MAIVAGAKLDAQDFVLPDPVTATGNGANAVTATSWAVLPTTTCTASITNPHPTAGMLVTVAYGAWMSAATAGDVRLSVDVSGALTIAPGVGGGAAIGWGEIPVATATQPNAQRQATITLTLPPGTTTFKVYAYKTGAGTNTVNYPTLRIIPIRYDLN